MSALDRLPLVAAHRGGRGHGAENSLAAIDNAITIGADMVEFDVRRTADGHLVIIHDRLVCRRRVDQLTRVEIDRLLGVDAPPLLEEVLRLCAGRIRLDVEIKESGYEAETLQLLRGLVPTADMVLTSFRDSVLATVKAIAPEIRCGLLLGTLHRRDLVPWQRVAGIPADFIAPSLAVLDTGLLHRARRRGVPVVVWTVNAERPLRRLLRHGTVEMVITDEPERALWIRQQQNPTAARPVPTSDGAPTSGQ